MVHFKVNNHDWVIGFIDPEDEELNEVTCGLTSYLQNQIIINSGMNKSQTISTIIHEVSHAFRWSYGFTSDAEPTKITNAEIEEIVANFTESFAEQIIKLSYDLYNKLVKENNGRTSKKS